MKDLSLDECCGCASLPKTYEDCKRLALERGIDELEFLSTGSCWHPAGCVLVIDEKSE